MRVVILGAVAALGLGAPPALSQVMYNGWNLGPDYGAMVEDMQRREAALGATMDQYGLAVAREAMQDPRCQSAYEQFRAAGGQMTPDQFGYECASRGRFTPEGERIRRDADAANAGAETQKRLELQDAERARGDAQTEYMEGFGENNREMGNVITGYSTWNDPVTGGQPVLPYTQPGTSYTDPYSGDIYDSDDQGNYTGTTPGGWSYDLQPME